MHAFLITGGTKEDRKNKAMTMCLDWNIDTCDIMTLRVLEEKLSIGITDVKETIRFLHLSPRQSPFTTLIIEDAEAMSAEAGQALLKTLEEPPANSRIILESPQESLLLPTIISRCQTVFVKKAADSFKTVDENFRAIMKNVCGKRIGEIIKFVDETFEGKQDATIFLETLLSTTQENLILSSSIPEIEKNTKIIRACLKARKELASNVHFRLVLDKFFLFYDWTTVIKTMYN
jgi:DNA polymerase III delta prime subunit